jgi:hypothetical protein
VIVAAAICPPAPLLIPGLADRLADRAGDLRAACAAAVAVLCQVDRVVILSAATSVAQGVLLPGDLVTAGGLARSDRPVVPPIRLPDATPSGDDIAGGRPDHPVAPFRPGFAARTAVGTAVGAHLLAAAGITVPTSALQVAPGAGTQLLDDGRTGLLVMADGAACHGEHAPGAPDPRSESFDADLVTALRSGDPMALAAACDRLAGLAAALRADSLPALAALATRTAGNGTARAEILHYSAPFGVGYLVATWQWGCG